MNQLIFIGHVKSVERLIQYGSIIAASDKSAEGNLRKIFVICKQFDERFRLFSPEKCC